ncbi:choice-of-anchor M domain-containing protein [Saccharothrix sp. 6-C]|uniref:choice-of-anchor M domain-containing protein n=1 Tax=Saccharothrix sp. 6-C TaxID=2781735 RepID=UPI001916CBDF|nr:choice-of-anchor M domain-containing protein [Saccharothrix sp. 6-C]QQQ73453.1 choice-of-anchor M domain-containing protein [Saccharothrix sp. 6-C]
MTTPTRARAAVAALAVAALAALSLTPALAQESAAVVDVGHVDLLAPVVVDGALDIRYKDGNTTPPTVRDPERVVTHVKPQSRIQVPDIPEYAFLGPVGSDLWLIPEIQDPDVVWAGWNTESLTSEQVDPESVRWTLDAIGGDVPGSAAPGELTVFQSGPVGEPLPRVFDTALPLPQQHPLVLGTHAHANWTFTAEGVYRLTFTVTATTPDGTPLSDTTTYAIAVGAVDPATVEPGTGTTPSTTTTTTTITTTTTTTTASTTTGTTTTTAPPTSCVVLDDGHVDLIAPRLLDGELTTQVKDGTAGPDRAVWRDPADVVLHLVPAARNTVPADPAYSFLGAPGAPVWLIPQTQVPGIVWAGWNTESLSPRDVTGGVDLRVTAVDGPGRLAVFLSGIAPVVLVDSGDGLPDTTAVPLGTHAHANWGFGAEGAYRVTVEVAATLADGRTVTDRDVFTIAVGDVDPAAGGACASPSTTPTTSTGTTSTGPAPTTSPAGSAPRPAGLASTGVGGVGTALLLAALLTVAGAAALVLTRRRRTHGG